MRKDIEELHERTKHMLKGVDSRFDGFTPPVSKFEAIATGKKKVWED